MRNFFDQYILNTIILNIAISLLFILWNLLSPNIKITSFWPIFILFFFIINVIIHKILIHNLEKNPKKFIMLFMSTTLAKLFLYLIALTLSIYFLNFNKISIIIPFLLLYLIYTFYEVKILSSIAKNKINK